MIDKQVKKYSDQLTKLGIAHEILEHPQFKEVEDVYAFFKLDHSSGASTLLMKADDNFIALIRRDDTQLNFPRLKTLINAGSLRVATEEEFIAFTGFLPGCAHVLMPNVTTYLDKKLFEKEYQLAGSGSFLYTVKYTSEDLKRIPNSHVVDVCVIKQKNIDAKKIVKGQIILAGITPSSPKLHIGNYLGAVKQFIELARNNTCYFFVADYHALTTVQKKSELQTTVESVVLGELSLLLAYLTKEEFDRLIFFRQSDVAGFHPELQSILNNITPLGLLKRAHAYKDKLAKETAEDDINLGLFNYPILMAADILLYKPDLVPVGKDQKQHIEITRDIAERFNHIYKKQVFKLPDGYIPEDVATIMGTDGKRKMSKSLGNIISIFEPEEIIHKQVMSTYTDPTRIHANDPGHIEGNMVFVYLDFFGNKEKVDQMKEAYTKGQIADIEVKEYLYESLIKFFTPARKRYEELKNNPELVKEILAKGAEKAKQVAGQTMKEVREIIGLKNAYSIEQTKKSTITIDDFSNVEVRVGKVEQAEHVEKSEKLIRLHVDFEKFGKRVIFTGVRTYGYTANDFVGKQFLFVVNLEYRKMLGEESQGMILAVDGLELPFGQHGDVKPIFVSAEGLPIGSKVR